MPSDDAPSQEATAFVRPLMRVWHIRQSLTNVLARALDEFARQAVERERERCAAIAQIWTETQANEAASTSPERARAIAAVTRYTAERIKTEILEPSNAG